MEARLATQESTLTHSLFTSRLQEFWYLGENDFENRIKMCIYNHCIEDRQKNLVFMSEMPTVCRLVTIKPLSHIAYVIPKQSE